MVQQWIHEEMPRSILIDWLCSLPCATVEQSKRLNPRSYNYNTSYEGQMPIVSKNGKAGMLLWVTEAVISDPFIIGKFGCFFSQYLLQVSPLLQTPQTPHISVAWVNPSYCQWYPRLDKSIEAAFARFTLREQAKSLQAYKRLLSMI
jgi:hypothetical protein